MKAPRNAIGRASAVVAFCAGCLFCGCKARPTSDALRAPESVAVSLANPQEPFAISPDGSLVVHALAGIVDSERVHESIFEFRDAESGREAAAVRLPVQANMGFQLRDIEFCDHGRYVMAVGPAATIFPSRDPASTAGDLITATSEDSIKIVDVNSRALHADISLSVAEHSPSAEALTLLKMATYTWRGGASFSACAANAPIAAVVIDYGNGVTEVKVFNLDSGTEIPGFDSLPVQTHVLGLAVSPAGLSLALFREENKPGATEMNAPNHCITVIDVRTKKVAQAIWVSSDSPASTVIYAGERTVAAELIILEAIERTGLDRTGPTLFHYHATVHFFDVGSGSELRVLSDPEVENFRLRGISADGRTMLAYAEQSHQCQPCNHGAGRPVITDARFTLWNPQTGQMLGKSPELNVVHHTCPWFSLQNLLWRDCVTSDEPPTLKLSQDGNAVAGSWPLGGQPIVVYSLPQH